MKDKFRLKVERIYCVNERLNPEGSYPLYRQEKVVTEETTAEHYLKQKTKDGFVREIFARGTASSNYRLEVIMLVGEWEDVVEPKPNLFQRLWGRK